MESLDAKMKTIIPTDENMSQMIATLDKKVDRLDNYVALIDKRLSSIERRDGDISKTMATIGEMNEKFFALEISMKNIRTKLERQNQTCSVGQTFKYCNVSHSSGNIETPHNVILDVNPAFERNDEVGLSDINLSMQSVGGNKFMKLARKYFSCIFRYL